MEEQAIVLHEFFPHEEAEEGLPGHGNQSTLEASDDSFDGNYEGLKSVPSTGNELKNELEAAASTSVDESSHQKGARDAAVHDMLIREHVSSYLNGTKTVVDLPSLEDTMTDDSLNFDVLAEDAIQTEETMVEPIMKDQEDPLVVGDGIGPPVTNDPRSMDRRPDPLDHEEEDVLGYVAENAMDSTLIDEGMFGSPEEEHMLNVVDENTAIGLYDTNDHHYLSDLRHLMTTPM